MKPVIVQERGEMTSVNGVSIRQIAGVPYPVDYSSLPKR